MGDTGAAERDADEYYRARADGSPSERSTALTTRGRIQIAAGQSDAAEVSLKEAAALARENRLYYNEARAAFSLALLYWDSRRPQDALARLSRAVELSVKFDHSGSCRTPGLRSCD
jgi:tetratricopeptide (TPR) repeat protein